MISRFACILKMMQHSLILAKYSVTVVQLAKAHNDDQQFSRDLSHNEILQMMHATFMKAGGDANAKTFAVKQQALSEVGILVNKCSDPLAKRWDNSWQLACHTGEIWDLLTNVFKLTLEGKLKGMSATAKKYVDASFREAEGEPAGPPASGGKSRKGRTGPKSARPPMPRSKALQDLKDMKVEVPDIKQDVWKRFIGVESKEGGTQFYIELLRQVCNLQLSMQEAGTMAVDFKRHGDASERFRCDKLGRSGDSKSEALYPRAVGPYPACVYLAQASER